MVSIETTTSRRDGVTCVEAVLANEAAVPLRVTCTVAPDRLWPPLRRGVPEAGWDDDTVTVTVPAGGRTGVGFATPAPPDEECITVASETAEADAAGDGEPMADVGGVVRTLGDGRPPRDALPAPGVLEESAAAPEAVGGRPAAPDATGEHDDGDGGSTDCNEGGAPDGDASGARAAAGADEPDGLQPPADSAFEWVEAPVARPVAAWLDDVEARLDHVEALGDDPTVARATELLAAAGGVRGVRRTARAGPRLRRLAARADALADRVEAVEAPLEDLEALS
jgi:hypothetical protein